MYVLPLGNILKSHNIDYHMFADNTQLYTSALPHNLSSLLLKLQNCCDYVRIWMHKIKLKLNNDKTEVFPCSTETKLSKVHISYSTLVGITIAISNKAQNLGVILDNTFSMEHQINAVVKSNVLWNKKHLKDEIYIVLWLCENIGYLIGFVSPRLLQLTASRNHRAENFEATKSTKLCCMINSWQT